MDFSNNNIEFPIYITDASDEGSIWDNVTFSDNILVDSTLIQIRESQSLQFQGLTLSRNSGSDILIDIYSSSFMTFDNIIISDTYSIDSIIKLEDSYSNVFRNM